MVSVSDPEAPPRRDGWLERRGVWGEVTVGSLLKGQNRTDVWEVIDSAHPAQVEPGYTLWFKVRNQGGEEHAIRPHMAKAPVTFLMKDDIEQPPPRQHPSDSAVLELLAEKLGARHIATRDNATGEITCPNYGAGHPHSPEWRPGILMVDELEHLRICHGIDTGGLEAIGDADERLRAVATVHGQAHNRRHPGVGKGGVPHRHVPEDRTAL